MPDEENKNPEAETPVESETTAVAEEKQITTPNNTAPVAPEAAATSQATEATAPANAPAPSTAGTLVLQWLTYAFWGWLILGQIWLMTVITVNAILNEPVSGMIPYAIAASVVLLPLAYFTDRFYSKKDSVKKTGGEAVIMIVHAVIFAILGILALILAVFTSINLALSLGTSGSTDSQLTVLIVSGFAALSYVGAFLRTLNPFHSTKPNRIYSIAMLGLTVLLLMLAFIGPLMKDIATREDRLIEDNLSSVEASVSSYIQDNNKLPDSLKDLSLSNPGATQLVDKGLVEYKKDGSVKTQNLLYGSTTIEHRYQLCVNYKEASSSRDGYSYPSSYQAKRNQYESYVNTSYHGAGKECYKLQATVSDSDYVNKPNADVQIEKL